MGSAIMDAYLVFLILLCCFEELFTDKRSDLGNKQRTRAKRILERDLDVDYKIEDAKENIKLPVFKSFPLVKTYKKLYAKSKGNNDLITKLTEKVQKKKVLGIKQSHKDYMKILSEIQVKQNFDLGAVKSEMNARKLNEEYFNKANVDETSDDLAKNVDDKTDEKKITLSQEETALPRRRQKSITLLTWDELSD